MRIRSAIVVPLACIALSASFARAFVGVNDSCPVPTPSPPPGAGWAALNNPSMEGGFTGGAANQWIAWKDSTYTTQVHYAGDDRWYDGAHSQKLNLPQPPPDTTDQEAGIYQQIYVVVGGSYTVTAKFYLHFPPQTYNGEDLLGFLGVDPWGQESGDGYGMVWDEVSQQDQWVTASVTVQARMPVITVSVKGTRKWPQHGNGALVWMDALTITGPVPTDPPPDPEPEPVDPETLIPATVGPNLVSNPSFEQTYTGGVSAGWGKWWTLGSGTWSRSIRVGKVGGGKYDCLGEQELADLNPKTILLYGGNPEDGGNGVYGTLDFLNNFSHLDNTIFIGRPAVDDNVGMYFTNPTYYGARLADQLYLEQQEFPRIDCWQGLNEPDWGSNWQKVIQFEKAFADRAHQLGMKTCSLNLSTGSPGNIWRMVDEDFDPGCRDLLAVADYLGHHCYGGPADQLMVTNQSLNDACSFALRPRRFKDMYDRRGWRFPPVITTEGSTWGGWHGVFSPEAIGNDLMTMGEYMNADPWWCGYTNFVCGASCSWVGFEIVGQGTIVQDVGNWNYNNPADAVDGYYSQMFGSGNVHPKTVGGMTPDGDFNGGVNQQISGLTAGKSYLVKCWMKYEFRGHQPTQLGFHLGVDGTGQTSNGNAATIDWGDDQIADKTPIHEIFGHLWRTFAAESGTASIWLRASHPASDPSFRVYVDLVEVEELEQQPAAQTAPGFYQSGWNLTSVPVEPTNPEASAVFQDLVAIGNVINYNLYRYQPGAGYQLYPLVFSDVERGRGYWLWLDAAYGDTVVSVAGAVATDDVMLSVAEGWTLIGHPFPQSVPLSACSVTDGITTLSFAEAVAAGRVAGVLYSWEPGVGYRMTRAEPFGHDDSLRPWQGYWVCAMVPGLQLVVPVP